MLFLVAGLVVISPVFLQAFTLIQVDLSRIALGVAVLSGVFYLFFGALFRVTVWKVIAAPLLFRPDSEVESFVLEDVRDLANAKAPKRIDLVKYTSECPICGGRVVVGSGGFRFWARLVGRCQRSPREHVFSFDHVTEVGSRL
jgi:hypothetical protein